MNMEKLMSETKIVCTITFFDQIH